MSEPRSTYVACGPHELHVTEWGDPAKPPLVMWHGLARTGRDFDEVALALADTYFVICPDTLGRGMSSWAHDVATDYSYAAFGDHAEAIVDRYGAERLRWVGTSMGGLLGVTLAAGRLKGRISHLVVNDIGPQIPDEASGRIASYVGSPPVFDTMAELEAWLRTAYEPFGENPASFWRRMTDTSGRRTDAGKVTVHYDPQIVTMFTLHKSDLDCWPAWDAVEAPTLLLRGETSDVLPRDVADEMCARGPKPKFEELPGYGHAPTMVSEREQRLLRSFLAA